LVIEITLFSISRQELRGSLAAIFFYSSQWLTMKIQPLVTGLIVGALIGFGLTKFFDSGNKTGIHPAAEMPTGTTANTDSTVWPWADSLDAVKAAGKNHQVIFENEKIRILEVLLRPHEFETMHTHRLPSVMFGTNVDKDTSTVSIIYYRNGYDSINHRYFVKDSFLQQSKGGYANERNVGHYMKPEGPHQIKNLSNATIDVFRVEFKEVEKK
jgi:hypothetical protein